MYVDELLTVAELAIVVGDALSKVDVTGLTLTFLVDEGSTEDRDLASTLDGEVDVVSRAGETLAVPVEVAFDIISKGTGLWNSQLTVVVAEDLVKVDLSVAPLAIATLETGPEDVAVVDTDVLSRVVESHCAGWLVERL